MRIFKYKLELRSEQIVRLPYKRGEILSVQMQDGNITFWLAVDDRPSTHEEVQFRIVGTGGDYPDANHKYIGTVQDKGLVWHIFQKQGLSKDEV